MSSDDAMSALRPGRRLVLGAGAALAVGLAATKGSAMTSKATSGYATVDGLRIYYETYGGPLAGATPMVLLHGGAMTIETAFAADFIPRFSRARPVIAIEQQGHGHTGDRSGPMTLDRMVDDTSGVLAHLGVGRAHLLGHSLGAMIATGMAVRHPGQVASLIAISGTYNLDGMIPGIVAIQRDPTLTPSPEVIPLLPTQADFTSWKAAFERDNPGPGSFEEVLGRLNQMLTHWEGWTPAQLAAIRAPTLLAIGDNDFTRIEHAAEMMRLIPGAQLAVLPGTTHMNITTRGPWLEPLIEARIGSTS